MTAEQIVQPVIPRWRKRIETSNLPPFVRTLVEHRHRRHKVEIHRENDLQLRIPIELDGETTHFAKMQLERQTQLLERLPPAPPEARSPPAKARGSSTARG